MKSKWISGVVIIFICCMSIGAAYLYITSRPVYKTKHELFNRIMDKLEDPKLDNKDCFISIDDVIQNGQQYGYHICDKESIQLVYDIIKRSGTRDATGWQMKPAEYMISMYDISIGATYGSNFILMYSSEECIVKFELNERDTRLFSDILKNCRDNTPAL